MGAISFSIDERLLRALTGALPLSRFVETGTFQGESLRAARRFFKECYSVELSPEYYHAAVRNFASDPGVHLHLGESPSVLRELQSLCTASPTLFWLDAHWCAAEGTGGAEAQSPLLGEIQGIGSLHAESVILIDDARLYLCAPPQPHRLLDWPGFHEVATALLSLSSSHRLMVCNDVIFFYPVQIEAVMKEFAREFGTNWLLILHEWRSHRERSERRQAKRKNRWFRFK